MSCGVSPACGKTATPIETVIRGKFFSKYRTTMPSTLLRNCAARRSCGLGVSPGQNDDEFLAAEATGDVLVAEQAVQTLADPAQYHVAGVVAVIVIVFLEMIDIDRKDADAFSGARGSRKFAAAGLQHVAPVKKAGQRVADRLVAQLIAQFDVCDCEADLFGADKPQTALLGDRRFVGVCVYWLALAAEFEMQ